MAVIGCSFFRQRSVFGIAAGILGFVWSFLPMLVPRQWWAQGIVAGLVALLGYGLGALLECGYRRVFKSSKIADDTVGYLSDLRRAIINRSISSCINIRRAAGIAIFVFSGLFTVAIAFWVWQRNHALARVLGANPVALSGYLAACIFALGVIVTLIAASKLIAWVTGVVRVYLALRFGSFVSRVAGLVLVLLTVSTVFVTGCGIGLVVIKVHAKATDSSAAANIRIPIENERSGSVNSLQSWQNMGLQGKYFVSQGPRSLDIQRTMGMPAKEPIRVYASIKGGGNLEQTVATAIAELDRTHAWERDVLVVASATGTGWVNEWGVQAVEYLTLGDCATVSLQYSYLPSIMEYLTGSRAADIAGKALFDAVSARVKSLPQKQRPRLVLSGESLGAAGATAAFTDLNNLVDKVDGAVLAGTPSFAMLREKISTRLLPVTDSYEPVVKDFPQVRFLSSTSAKGLAKNSVKNPLLSGTQWFGAGKKVGDDWKEPRIAFMQHASDPVVWCSISMLWSRPDWYEQAGTRDTLYQPPWIPLISFLMLVADMPGAQQVPSGHGHTYRKDLIYAWSLVLKVDAEYSNKAIDAVDSTLNHR